MTDEYIPTIGEYAEIIKWLVDYPGQELPQHMLKAYNDALERAEMRRFARSMEDMADAAEFTLGYRPPEWQLVWLNADFSKSDKFRLGLHAGRIRNERNDALTRRLFKVIEQSVRTGVAEREVMFATAIDQTHEYCRGRLYGWQEKDGSWRVASKIPGAGRASTQILMDEFLESSVRGYNLLAERWLR